MNIARQGMNRSSWFLSAAILPAILAVGFAPSARAGVNDSLRAVCGASSSNGNSATAIASAIGVSVEITNPSGTVSHLSHPLVYHATDTEPAGVRPDSCKVCFDRESDLIALGVSYGVPGHFFLAMSVADAVRAIWIGKWTVGPASGIYQPQLLGFLEGTTSVVVGGEPSTPTQYGPGIQHGSFRSLLFTPQGGRLRPMDATRRYGSSSDFFPVYADAGHNRLWVFRCVVVSAPWSRQPDCPVSWMTLAGNLSSSPEFDPRKPGDKRTDFWTLPSAFAAPNGNTILVAQGDTVWLADMQKQAVARLILPKRLRFPESEGIYGPAAISPDGEVVALPLVRDALAFPYLVDSYNYKGTDFAVVQLHPLQLLGILPGSGANSPASCAVDDRQGQAVVLVFRHDHWERTKLRRAPPS